MQLNNPNRMIQALCRSPEGAARLRADREAVFSEYNLTEAEKIVLRSDDTLKMVSAAKVHPILVMHYLLATNPQAADSMNWMMMSAMVPDSKGSKVYYEPMPEWMTGIGGIAMSIANAGE